MKLTCRVVLLCACVAALTAAPAHATPRFGVAEDATKYADDGGASLYPKLTALGMETNRMTVHWDPTDPTTIQERGFLDRALPVAARAGVRIVLDVYPSDRYAFTTGSPELRATLFGAYLQTLARRYPQVNDFIVGNEPNESYFWRPQFGPGKKQVSAAAFLRTMTAAYDALKAVDPKIRVIAAGPSNEGNDKTSTSPVRFIAALGDAYRESAPSMPFMDAMGFHVYPRNNTHPPSKRYTWPNIGPSDLARVKQAVWDAFADTPQPTFAQSILSPKGSLGLVVDEFGWQVAIGPRLAARYTNKENVPTITEAEQAEYYGRADPDVRLRSRGHGRDDLPPRRRGRPQPVPVRAAADQQVEASLVRCGRQGHQDGRSLREPGELEAGARRDRREGDLRDAGPPGRPHALRHLCHRQGGRDGQGGHLPHERSRRQARAGGGRTITGRRVRRAHTRV